MIGQPRLLWKTGRKVAISDFGKFNWEIEEFFNAISKFLSFKISK